MTRSTANSKGNRKPAPAAVGNGSKRKMDQMAAELAAAKEEIAKAKKRNAELIDLTCVSSSSKGNKKAKVEQNDGLIRQIKKAIKKGVWSAFKFISSRRQERKFSGFVLDNIGFDYDATQRKAWIKAHSATVCAQLNIIRMYNIQRMKDAAKKFWVSHNRTLPTVDDIIGVGSRTVFDETSKACVDAWTLYWDYLLPAAVGNTHDWSHEKRYYGIISTSAPDDKPDEPYITISTEAFTMVVYDNCRDSWIEMFKLKDKFPNHKQYPCKKPRKEGVNDDEENEEDGGDDEDNSSEATELPDMPPLDGQNNGAAPENNGKKPDKGYTIDGLNLYITGNKFKGKYTITDGGQAKYGGWSNPGLTKYNSYMEANSFGRTSGHCVEIERNFLTKLRADVGVKFDTYQDELRAKKKKVKKNDDEPDEIVDTWGGAGDDGDTEEI